MATDCLYWQSPLGRGAVPSEDATGAMCIEGHATGYLLITLIYFSRSLEWARLICRWHFQWPAVFIWGIRQAQTWTIQNQWQYFIKHSSLSTDLGADSCARKKRPSESSVAEGNLIAVLQSLVDNLYGPHKGHEGWQKPRCGASYCR